MRRLGFGYNAGLPDGIEAAWGARLIVRQDGYTDFLGDRQDAFGEKEAKEALFAWLSGAAPHGGAMDKAREHASWLLKNYEMRTRESKHFVLYEDDEGAVVGNTNASAGYLHVAAYLKAGEEYDGGPTPEEYARLMANEPTGTRTVHVGEEVFEVIDDPDDPDHGLRIGVD